MRKMYMKYRLQDITYESCYSLPLVDKKLETCLYFFSRIHDIIIGGGEAVCNAIAFIYIKRHCALLIMLYDKVIPAYQAIHRKTAISKFHLLIGYCMSAAFNNI